MNGRNNIYETENGKSVNRRDSGFTLIEIVVAMLVLTIGLLGTATMAFYVIKENKSSRQISTATALAQDKMEKLRELGYENLPAPNSTVTEDYGSIRINEDEDPPPEFDNYKRVVFVKPIKYLYSDGTVSETLDPTKNITTSTKPVIVWVYWVSNKPNPGDEWNVEITMLFSR